MNKFNVGLAALALTVTGCSNDFLSMEGETGNPISFTAYNGRLTKSVIDGVIDSSNKLESFKVAAFDASHKPYFTNVKFTKDSTSLQYHTTLSYFWPAFALDIFAYNEPKNTTSTTYVDRYFTDTEMKLFYTLTTDFAAQEDLVAARAFNQTYSNTQPATLTFNHYLSSIECQAKNCDMAYAVRVRGVKFMHFMNEGKYDFLTGESGPTRDPLTKSQYTTTYVSEFTEETVDCFSVSRIMDNLYKFWYMVPQTVNVWDPVNDPKNTKHGAYIAVNLRISTGDSYEVYDGWVAIPLSADGDGHFTFAAGKRYEFVLDFFKNGGCGYHVPYEDDKTEVNYLKPIFDSNQPIQFNSSYTSWENQESVSIDL